MLGTLNPRYSDVESLCARAVSIHLSAHASPGPPTRKALVTLHNLQVGDPLRRRVHNLWAGDPLRRRRASGGASLLARRHGARAAALAGSGTPLP